MALLLVSLQCLKNKNWPPNTVSGGFFSHPNDPAQPLKKKKTIMQKINKEKQLDCGCVGVFVCTQPVICECSAGALLECCQRLLAVICV